MKVVVWKVRKRQKHDKQRNKQFLDSDETDARTTSKTIPFRPKKDEDEESK